ncbi:MAG: ATP-dependent 6-phosphofructokinase [Actinobacteria bacterium]|nr:ATP-dependent 6-phosphofructokinase [Actinomycetota bacterium]
MMGTGNIKKVGLLTGGGDSSAINDYIRTIVILLEKQGIKIRGIKGSYKGLIEDDFMDLTCKHVNGIQHTGGTCINTSRTNPYKLEGAVQKIIKNVEKENLDALICVGGNDTLGVALKLANEGIKVVGIPQTIDNDILETDHCIGFHSAVENIVKCTNMVTTSSFSHEREMIVEVMGRDSGFLALNSSLVLGADSLLIPEFPADLDKFSDLIQRKRKAGKKHGLFIVAEGVRIQGGKQIQDDIDAFGHIKLGGISYVIAEIVHSKIGIKPNVTVLGYTQRGGTPCPYDAFLATVFAKGTYKNLMEDKFGYMVAVVNEKPKNVPIADAVKDIRLVSKEDYDFAAGLGDIW